MIAWALLNWKSIAKGIAIVALIMFCWWAWDHYVAEPYIAKGVAQEHIKTVAEKIRADEAEAANVTLADQKRALQTAYADQTAATLAVSEASAAQLKAKDALVARHAKTEGALHTQILTLQAVRDGPPSTTKQEACDEATRLLDAYAAGQLRK